jgi:MoaA/NifB/PqqE/SkfB family radical SAM enzyme
MTYTDALRRTWNENILLSAMVELTYRCNLDCFICYNDTSLKGVPLAVEDYLRFFEDLRELGTLNLTLTGGEPLAHPAFFRLGREARELGFVVRVKSNAHALRHHLARRMKDEVDPYLVEVSLHGACAESHDRQTRVPGSFARLIVNLRDALALGLRIKLNAPVTLWNEHEIEAMHALADDLGAAIDFDPAITRRDDGGSQPQQVAPSRAGVARLLAHQRQRAAIERSRQTSPAVPSAQAQIEPPSTGREKHCGAGSSSITVDPYGNVYPCVQWRRRIGNLHEQSIPTLWHHSDELTEVRRLAIDVKRAVDDHDAPGTGFCPGSAELETGSPTRVYPAIRVLLDMRARAPTGVAGAETPGT